MGRKTKAEVALPRTSETTFTQVALAGACAGGLLVGLPSSAAFLIGGAAVCGAWGVLFVPLTFGFSVPFSASFCASAGLWSGALWGAAAGASGGAFFFGVAYFFGYEAKPSWWLPGAWSMRHALLGFCVTTLLGPLCAAVGAVMGMCSGAFLGLVAGSLLAPLTLAMSLPFCLLVSAVIGAALDAAAGAALGVCLGALAVWQKDRCQRKLQHIMEWARNYSEPWRLQLAKMLSPDQRHVDDAHKENDMDSSDAESTNDAGSDMTASWTPPKPAAPFMIKDFHKAADKDTSEEWFQETAWEKDESGRWTRGSRTRPAEEERSPTASTANTLLAPYSPTATVEDFMELAAVFRGSNAWCPVSTHLKQSPRYRGERRHARSTH